MRRRNGSPLAASYVPRSSNGKLGRVLLTPKTSDKPAKLISLPPFVAATAVSMAATCPCDCPVREGCYYPQGFTKQQAQRLDVAAAGLTSTEAIAQEVELLDGAFGGRKIPQDGARGGRDLRIHVGGEVGCEHDSRLLAGAAERWLQRGGGAVWTYTHRWREIPREAWGPIHVIASVEKPEEIEEARARGYPAAIVLESFPSRKAFYLPGASARIVPCPAEHSQGRVCATCRLCLDRDLLGLGVAIAFQAHGHKAAKIREALAPLRKQTKKTASRGNKSLEGRARSAAADIACVGGAA